MVMKTHLQAVEGGSICESGIEIQDRLTNLVTEVDCEKCLASHCQYCNLELRLFGPNSSVYCNGSNVCHRFPKVTVAAPAVATILDEAAKIVSGVRQNEYGAPEDSFQMIADLWTTFLGAKPEGAPLTRRDVCSMMILLKVARDANRPKRDNLVDVAGYARCAEIVTP